MSLSYHIQQEHSSREDVSMYTHLGNIFLQLDKFALKKISLSYHIQQKHSSKQVVSMIYALGKDFFAAG